MMKCKGLFLVFGLFVAFSCKEKSAKGKFLPGSTGAVNSVIVVMENDLWQGGVGDKVRELFARPTLATPQVEPILSLTQVPPQVFSGAVSHSRSILYVRKDTLSISHVKTDVYASPQKVAVVKGKDEEELLTFLDDISEKAINSFKANEIAGIQKRLRRSLSKEPDLTDEFGISLAIPSAYTVGKHEDNFVWIDRQIPKGNMNIIAYTMPDSAFSNDSTFVADIVRMRDSIGKKYIPGPDVVGKKTYMVTEKAFAPYVFPAEIAKLKAVEVRGIWEMQGYAMAGSFLTYIINDKKNARKIVLEGFIFKPSANKRDDLLELESILRTLEFKK